MLEITEDKKADTRTLWINLPSPTVYLDHCIIGDLAGTPDGERIRQRICKQGTLYLSWAHFVELFSLGDGLTFQRLHSYLTSFGPNFIIVDSDADAIIKREQKWSPGKQNPAIDEEFLKVMIAKWKGESPVTISLLLEFMAKEKKFFENIKSVHTRHKDNIKAIFDKQRQLYRTDKNVKKLLDAAVYKAVKPNITSKVNLELSRECVRTNEQFNPSDSLDFHHAVVSVSYCQFAVFDKKWARRCNSLNLPPKAVATVFNGKQIANLVAAIGT